MIRRWSMRRRWSRQHPASGLRHEDQRKEGGGHICQYPVGDDVGGIFRRQGFDLHRLGSTAGAIPALARLVCDYRTYVNLFSHINVRSVTG